MVYIAAALYYEAEPLIRLLKLKKNGSFDKFQVFQGDAAVLIITGPGEISAAAAVSYLCASLPVSAGDIFINYGTCAAREDIPGGALYAIQAIEQQATGRRFYPDMLLDNDFLRADLVTVPVPAVSMEGIAAPLADMEAAGLYLAAQLFFSQERMFFFKVVLDHPGANHPGGSTKEHVTPETVRAVCGSWAQTVWTFAKSAACIAAGCPEVGDAAVSAAGGDIMAGIVAGAALSDGDGREAWDAARFAAECAAALLATRLSATEAMTKQLQQYLYYRQLCAGDAVSYIQEFMERFQVPQCRTKKEGMPWLERLRRDLIETG